MERIGRQDYMFRKLSEDQMFEVMKNLAYAFNWGWLKSERLAIEKYGLEVFLGQEFLDLFREFGSRQCRKLLELSVVSGTDADSVIRGLKLSHWALFENVELTKTSDEVVRMRTVNCSLQSYAKKKLGTVYPCKNLHFALEARKGFVKTINARATVECAFSPPDPKPKNISENVSCEWIIRVPNQQK